MNDTPRSDAAMFESGPTAANYGIYEPDVVVEYTFAQELERELNKAEAALLESDKHTTLQQLEIERKEAVILGLQAQLKLQTDNSAIDTVPEHIALVCEAYDFAQFDRESMKALPKSVFDSLHELLAETYNKYYSLKPIAEAADTTLGFTRNESNK